LAGFSEAGPAGTFGLSWRPGPTSGALGVEPAACILPPQAIEDQAKAKAEEDAKLKTTFESGQIADL